jgi:adenylate cyclase
MALSVACGALFVLYSAQVFEWRFLRHLENLAYDLRLQLTLPKGQDKRVVIIDIDEKSLAAEGRWPWGRDRLARMVDHLFDHYQIAVLGMDVVWAERDESSGLPVLEKLAQNELKDDPDFPQRLENLRPMLDRDALFATSLKNRPVVLGYYFDTEAKQGKGSTTGSLPAPVLDGGAFQGRKVSFVSAHGYGANLPEFQAAATDAGHFNPVVDQDGVVRRVPLLIEYQGNYYASLSLSIARLLLDNPPIEPQFMGGQFIRKNDEEMEYINLAGKLRIPVDKHVRALIPYRGPGGSFPYISAADVLHKRAPADALKGTVALLGTSAPGLLDLRSTPVQANYPGVEIHANMVAGIIDRSLKENPRYTEGAEAAQLVLLSLLLALALPALSPLLGSALTAALLLLVTGLNFLVWSQGNLVLPLASSLMLVLMLYVLHMSYGFFIESRGKRQLAGLFGQYIPPEIVDEMSRNPEGFSMEGEDRDMTVLFSDVRDFTTISETLEPAQLRLLMNAFLTPITQIIHTHRGTIDKYMGDAVMAFWGAPLKDEQHAQHAVEAALAITEKLAALQPEFAAKGWPPLRIGVGINSGSMAVGDMGSEFRRAYTVMGDAVNLGSRLEGLTKEYGVQIMVSEFTRNAVSGFVFRELDRVRVKGKEKPVVVYEPLCRSTDFTKEMKDELKLYELSLKYYREQNWDMAELQFLNLAKRHPDTKLYSKYVERVAYLRAHPPGDKWDGVAVFKTK